MTFQLTSEQIARIRDMDSYREVTGSKRFKRTKEEMLLGLTPEQALGRRLHPETFNAVQRGAEQARAKQFVASPLKGGHLTISISPEVGVSTDFLDTIPSGNIKLVMPENFYSWVHTRLAMPYEGDIQKLIKDMIVLGLGEVITKSHFPEDITNAGVA